MQHPHHSENQPLVEIAVDGHDAGVATSDSLTITNPTEVASIAAGLADIIKGIGAKSINGDVTAFVEWNLDGGTAHDLSKICVAGTEFSISSGGYRTSPVSIERFTAAIVAASTFDRLYFAGSGTVRKTKVLA